jgi:hypothetical protein
MRWAITPLAREKTGHMSDRNVVLVAVPGLGVLAFEVEVLRAALSPPLGVML